MLFAIAVFGVFVIISGITVVFSWYFAESYATPLRLPRNKSPMDYGMSYEDICFFSHGTKIRGWLISSHDSGSNFKITIILNHQWSRNADRMLPFARFLHAAGFNLLLYDARSHGESGDDGYSSIYKFSEDLISAIDYLCSRADVNLSSIGVLGHSMGAASAILANARDHRIKALVSDAAFSDPVELTRLILKTKHIPQFPFRRLICKFVEQILKLKMDEVSPLNNIGKISNPVLLIHGENDRLVPCKQLEELYDHSNRLLTEKWLVQNRGHSVNYLDKKYSDKVVSFFQSAFCNSVENRNSVKIKIDKYFSAEAGRLRSRLSDNR